MCVCMCIYVLSCSVLQVLHHVVVRNTIYIIIYIRRTLAQGARACVCVCVLRICIVCCIVLQVFHRVALCNKDLYHHTYPEASSTGPVCACICAYVYICNVLQCVAAVVCYSVLQLLHHVMVCSKHLYHYIYQEPSSTECWCVYMTLRCIYI